MMEKGLFARSDVVSFGRTYSKSLVGESFLLRNSRHSCYRGGRGNVIKASYLAARTSSRDFDSSSHHLLLENNSSKSFRSSRECLNTSVRTGYVLDSHEDEYGGVIVNLERLPWDADDFGFMLHKSLSFWKSKAKKGIWLKLPLEQSELVPVAVKEGFKYHHAEEEYVMLTYWIPQGPSMLPANASHQVGVGGFVINEKNEDMLLKGEYCCHLKKVIYVSSKVLEHG